MKYICIHGHFYQPPRENAWLETIELQDSAAPYHDWNERINEECYAPNATARILDERQRITAVTNNYARISWNMGPTLLSWLEVHDPSTYARLLAADTESQARFGGHGSAMAQAYNHLILPLANARDQQTQIKWGIADFERRFGRKPEGMWLAETAVDTASLEALVDNGIKFTVLAPRQCQSVRAWSQGPWEDVGEGVDTCRAYRCPLPSGRIIDLFYYDGGVSKAVAFEGLLNDGKLLADRLMNTLGGGEEAQLAHIATDGESYGHHHRRGEMALAACLDHIDANPDFLLTNYGHFLELHPPEWETRIHDNSSWSCVHGVERWRSNCGCHTGGEPGWNQAWREPLRAALDGVRDRLTEVYEREGRHLYRDPWVARDAYIELVLDRGAERSDAFLARHAVEGLDIDAQTKTRMLRLLEMQRHAMLMYTSCAWFFNEVSGIETLQVLQYANRALHLCETVTGENFHPEFLAALERTPSNTEDNAAVAYRREVMPARVGLYRVGMHFAVASLFEAPATLELFNYRAMTHRFERFRAGNQRLSVGRITVRSNLTHSRRQFSFAVLHLGQQAIIGEITQALSEENFDELLPELEREFRVGHANEVINLMKDNFAGGETFSVWHLFRDEKREILLDMSEHSLKSATADFRAIYYDNYQLMSTMQASHLPLPEAYLAAVRYTLRQRLLRLYNRDDVPLNLGKTDRIIGDYRHWNHRWLNPDDITKASEQGIFRRIGMALEGEGTWEEVLKLIETARALDLAPNLYRAQNAFLEGLPGNLNEPPADRVDVARALELAVP